MLRTTGHGMQATLTKLQTIIPKQSTTCLLFLSGRFLDLNLVIAVCVVKNSLHIELSQERS